MGFIRKCVFIGKKNVVITVGKTAYTCTRGLIYDK